MRDRTAKTLLVAAMLAPGGSHALAAQHATPALTAPITRPVSSLPEPRVRRAQLWRSSQTPTAAASTKRYVLIGAGVGAALGLAVGAISVHNHPPRDSYSPSARATVIGLGILGAAAGALVGWVLSAVG